MVPTIHLNGTSCQELMDQIVNVERAGRKMLQALYDASPNGRDYYTQGDNAFHEVQSEHQDRVKRIQSVIDEIQEIADSISEWLTI